MKPLTLDNHISFEINNGQQMTFEQSQHDDYVIVTKANGNNKEIQAVIPAGDFVMMFNYYQWVKHNNIKNDFLNPYGTNTEI